MPTTTAFAATIRACPRCHAATLTESRPPGSLSRPSSPPRSRSPTRLRHNSNRLAPVKAAATTIGATNGGAATPRTWASSSRTWSRSSQSASQRSPTSRSSSPPRATLRSTSPQVMKARPGRPLGKLRSLTAQAGPAMPGVRVDTHPHAWRRVYNSLAIVSRPIPRPRNVIADRAAMYAWPAPTSHDLSARVGADSSSLRKWIATNFRVEGSGHPGWPARRAPSGPRPDRPARRPGPPRRRSRPGRPPAGRPAVRARCPGASPRRASRPVAPPARARNGSSD